MRQKLLPVLTAILCSIAPLAEGYAQSGAWQKVDGPAGSCSAIAIDPDNRIYVQTTDRMYRSMNDGETWTQDGTPVPGGATLLWSAADGSVFAAGGISGGVYRSTDNGSTWATAGLEGMAVTSAIVTPAGALLAGTNGAGLYYSEDNGANWGQLYVGSASGRVHAVINTPEGDIMIATEVEGIFRSGDGGETWVEADAGIPSGPVVDLAVDSRNRLYAATRGHGLFVSDDNGASWEVVGMSKWTLASISISKGDVVYVSASNPEPVLVRSNDRGAIWEEVVTGLGSATVHDVAFDSRGHLFAATTQGIFRTVESTSSVGNDNGAITGMKSRLYPNPVTVPQATLEVELKTAGETSVTLLSSDGRVIGTPFSGWLPSGINRIEIDRAGLAAGQYLCAVRTAAGVTTEKLVVE